MAKLVLQANPTFKGVVSVPTAEGELVTVEFTFKHRTKTALDAFVKTRDGVDDADSLLEMAAGWDLADPFNRDSAKLLLENYIGSAVAVYRCYVEGLTQAKAKN